MLGKYREFPIPFKTGQEYWNLNKNNQIVAEYSLNCWNQQ